MDINWFVQVLKNGETYTLHNDVGEPYQVTRPPTSQSQKAASFIEQLSQQLQQANQTVGNLQQQVQQLLDQVNQLQNPPQQTPSTE
jgi:peptidoglycan hydrolase CwlO-like protein